jgi:hypothetical protein
MALVQGQNNFSQQKNCTKFAVACFNSLATSEKNIIEYLDDFMYRQSVFSFIFKYDFGIA